MEASSETLHQVNARRTGLTGVNSRPIPDGPVIHQQNGNVIVLPMQGSSGFRYTLRPNGTLLSVQHLTPASIPAPPQGYTSTSPARAIPSPIGVAVPSARPDSATFRPNGKISTLHTASLDIRTAPRGQRVITSRRPDNTILVRTGPHSGYLQRPAKANGRAVTERIYLSGTNTYRSIYVGTTFHGLQMLQYQPIHAYPASFYEWVYGGWGSPASYRWNLSQQRWYASYRSFFVPWPSYAYGSLWLTDYFLAQTLEDGFGMQQSGDSSTQPDASAAADPGTANAAPDAVPQPDADGVLSATQTTPIAPELKQTIAAQIDDQLLAEDASDSHSAPAPNQDAPVSDLTQIEQPGYVFVVNVPISVAVDRSVVASVAGTAHTTTATSLPTCSLSPGDVLRVIQPPGAARPPYVSPSSASSTVTTSPVPAILGVRPAVLEVVASQRGDCPGSLQVDADAADLEEMENNFRARIDDGLQVLSSRQPKDGLPAAPPSAEPVAATSAQPAEPLPNVAAMLQALPSEANRAEVQFTQSMFSEDADAAAH